MADVKPYQQGQLASEAVGTPGANGAPGAAVRQLATGAGQVRDDLAAQAAADSSALGTLAGRALGEGIRSLGQALVDQRKAAAKQDKMLTDIEVAEAHYSFERNADRTRSGLQEEFIDNPLDARGHLSDRLEDSAAKLKERYKGDPRAQLEMVKAVEQSRTSQLEKMDSWVRGRRHDMAKQSGDVAIERTLQDISESKGSMFERLELTKSYVELADRQLRNSVNVLGQKYVDAKLIELHNKAGATFFANVAAELPDDPEARLAYMNGAKLLLDHSQESGVHLDAKDKGHLQSHFKTMGDQFAKDFENHLEVKDLGSNLEASVLKAHLDENSTNKIVQKQGKDYAVNMIAGLKAKAALVEKDPNLPESARLAYGKFLTGQATRYDGIIKAATSHENRIDSEAQADARHAKSEAKADARQAKTIATEQKKIASNDAQIVLNGMTEDLTVLKQDPLRNMAAIQGKAIEMGTLAQKSLAAGHLTPAQAHRYTQNALNIATNAATFQRNVSSFLGITLPSLVQPPVKKQNFDKSMGARVAAADAVSKGINEAREYQKQDEINKLHDFTPSQQAEFDDVADKIRAEAAKGNWPQVVVNQRLAMLRSRVQQGGK